MQPKRRRRRNPGMWDWEDEQDLTRKPIWVKALTPLGTYAPQRVLMKSTAVASMRQIAHQEPDGTRPYIQEVQREADGRRDAETRHFVVKRQRNGVWMELEVGVNPAKQTLTCTCETAHISYLSPCIDGGGALMVMGYLLTQEDYIEANKKPPADPAAPAAPTPVKASKQAVPLTPKKSPPPTRIEGPRVSLSDIQLGTTDIAVGMLADLQPIYLDSKRIDGVILVEAPGFKVTAIGNATVVRNFTSDIVKPRLEAISETVQTAANRSGGPEPKARPVNQRQSSSTSAAPVQPAMMVPTTTTVVKPTAAMAGSPHPTEDDLADSDDPMDKAWCNAATAANFLIAAYEAAESRGIYAASTTTALIEGMYSLAAPTGRLENPQAYRQRIYDLTRDERRSDGSIRPSLVAREVESIRPDLTYWNSKKWDTERTASPADEHATEIRKSLKIGCTGQHWLAAREGP
jgi:hypothetical protein